MPPYEPFFRRNPPAPIPEGERFHALWFVQGLPDEFRLQVMNNLKAVIGERRRVSYTRASLGRELVTPGAIWRSIVDTIEHELGRELDRYERSSYEEVFHDWFFHGDTPVSWSLTAIEIALITIAENETEIANYQDEYRSQKTLADAVADINLRFRHQDLAYDIDPESLLVRVIDSDFMHSKVVSPTLSLIRSSGFAGVEAEFTAALEHHRYGREEAAIVEALKAFESTMKQICDERGWNYDRDRDTSVRLIDIVLENELLPGWVLEQFTHLRLLLSSGTPVTRNKVASHGSGSTPRVVPPYLATYAIHTAGANILLLIGAHQSKPID